MNDRRLRVFKETGTDSKRELHVFKEEQPIVYERPYKDPTLIGNPSRTEDNAPYTTYKTHPYITKYAEAIRQDLGLYFELLVGKPASIWRINKEGKRCDICTDPITGATLKTHCPECGGVGYLPPYIHVIDTNVILQYNAKQTLANYTGNMEVATDQLIILGNDLIDDRDIVYMLDTGDLYLIDSQQPDITALMGEVITQIATVSRLPAGDFRYPVIEKLINNKNEAERELNARKARFEVS